MRTSSFAWIAAVVSGLVLLGAGCGRVDLLSGLTYADAGAGDGGTSFDATSTEDGATTRDGASATDARTDAATTTASTRRRARRAAARAETRALSAPRARTAGARAPPVRARAPHVPQFCPLLERSTHALPPPRPPVCNRCPQGEVCDNGTCALNCDAGLARCGDSCVDLQTSKQNCRSCGTICSGTLACVSGACR
jgi:hypothetical protein